MSVTVDRRPLSVEEMGLHTVGQVIAHLQKEKRLVVHVLIDGREPDIKQMAAVRRAPLLGHTIFIETANPAQMANEVLDEVARQLDQADAFAAAAAELLQQNRSGEAMSKLSACFATWQHAQESVVKTAHLLRLNPSAVRAGDESVDELMHRFGQQLREIKSALESRDFVTLSDLLTYETPPITSRWRLALEALRAAAS